MNMEARKSLTLENELRHGIQRGELQLYYQPILDISQNRIAAFEALVRWNHPNRGFLLPADFIGLAEQTGLISLLGQWVLKEAIHTLSQWQQEFTSSALPMISVNVSPNQLGSNELPKLLTETFLLSGTRSESLILEITESAVMENLGLVLPELESIRNLGVHLALDDFGTGYSSLSHLKELPVSELKIDQSFIRNLTAAEDTNASMVRALVALGSALEVQVIAEGVENWNHIERLRKMGCCLAQGFFLGKPMPLNQTWQFLETYRHRKPCSADEGIRIK